MDLAEALLRRNLFVTAIRPPTVPAGTARLRVTPTAEHTRDDLDEVSAQHVTAVRLDLAEAVLGRSADYSAGHEQIAVAVDGHLVRYI